MGGTIYRDWEKAVALVSFQTWLKTKSPRAGKSLRGVRKNWLSAPSRAGWGSRRFSSPGPVKGSFRQDSAAAEAPRAPRSQGERASPLLGKLGAKPG